MSDLRSLPSVLLALLLAGSLAACDGGLFGTDDGNSPDSPAASPPLGDQLETTTTEPPDSVAAGEDAGDGISASDEDTPDFDVAAAPPEAESPDMSSAESVAQGSDVPVRFDNTQITTPRNDALLTVVNARNTAVLLVTSGLADAQLSEVLIPPGSGSQHLALPVGITFARLSSESDADAGQFSLELTLGAGTVTSLITRDSAGQLDAIPLVSESGSSDVTLAKVRLVQTLELGDSQLISSFSLVPRGPNGSGVEADFAGVSFDSPDSGYLELPAGDYVLSDTAGRFPAQDVSFDGGQAYTAIVRAASGEVLQLEVDSDLDVR